MTTRPIREALRLVDPQRFPYQADRAHAQEALDAALEAVRAIEEMAKFMVSVDTMRAPDPDDMRNAAKFNDLLEFIAKEAP